MTSRRDCVCLWWLRLWPGTYALTGWPYVSVSTTWKTRFIQRCLNTGQCTVLCVATAPKNENQHVASTSGIAIQSARGA